MGLGQLRFERDHRRGALRRRPIAEQLEDARDVGAVGGAVAVELLAWRQVVIAHRHAQAGLADGDHVARRIGGIGADPEPERRRELDAPHQPDQVGLGRRRVDRREVGAAAARAPAPRSAPRPSTTRRGRRPSGGPSRPAPASVQARRRARGRRLRPFRAARRRRRSVPGRRGSSPSRATCRSRSGRNRPPASPPCRSGQCRYRRCRAQAWPTGPGRTGPARTAMPGRA